MNIVPAEVDGREARIGGHVIALQRSYDKLPAGATIEIGIRPEFVHVATPAAGLLLAQVERVDDLGRYQFRARPHRRRQVRRARTSGIFHCGERCRAGVRSRPGARLC
jgi:glycerol transport system ATP-binding protein